MAQTDVNKLIQDFERSRVQLSAIEQQNQQLSMQAGMLEEALKELKDTKEEKVYKAAGSILILSEVKKVQKELEEQKETVDLRSKTVKKQEESLIDKLNKLKSEIETAQKGSKDSKGEN